MATIDIHDLETYDEGDSRRLKGISTVSFNSTEARLNIGFTVKWSAFGSIDRSTMSTLLKPYRLSEDHILSVIQARVNGETNAHDVRGDGRSSVEVPFEILVDIAFWRREVDSMIPLQLVEALQAVLCLAVEANATPELGAGKCSFLQLEFPEESE